jgi:hypothetical protein
MAKGIVVLSKVSSVYAGHIYSVVSNVELENGMFGHIGDLVSGEREVRNFETPTTATIATKSLAVIATPEINYDESKTINRNLGAFSIPTGTVGQANQLKADDELRVSSNMITPIGSEVVVGNYLVAQNASMKLKEVATLAGTEKFVAKIEAKEVLGTTTVVGASGTLGNIVNLVAMRVIQN